MIATYRLQLQPGFGFDEVRALLPYVRRLGISHLYLSPITDARRGSPHGYDVVDHNRIRDELGGADAFRALLQAARAAGLAFILDIVPNHAGVGPRNTRWQDVLAYGPHSPYATAFDIDWLPLKPELHHRILLPHLGATYGEALDRREIRLVYEEGRLAAAYGMERFALSPRTYGDVLAAIAGGAEDLEALAAAFGALAPHERRRADVLRERLAALAGPLDLPDRLARLDCDRIHRVLERQFWRLSYWKTAAHEINYRRFFDVNDLVALRMERPEVFADAHRLVARLVRQPGIAGVRVDHVDGLFDPHGYLARLRDLGVPGVWVEKILAPGERLPDGWPVEGTSGYEFLNDVLGVLTRPDGALPLDRIYRRFVRDAPSHREAVVQSRRHVVETSLAGELFRLAYDLDRISEGDYHTRDLTFEALREALAEVVAVFTRYRTYLPHDREDAEQAIREALYDARQRRAGGDPLVFTFIGQVLRGDVAPALREAAAAWTGRFQQYTAPVAAKGVEDTAFYRSLRLVALNEVGGDPDRLGMAPAAFHARARFRALRYPRSLLATATHDHKRGEDLRMRLIVLAELPQAWAGTVAALARVARRHRTAAGPSRADEFLFYQILVGLWDGADRASLPERLVAYGRKAAREAKQATSWVHPNEEYEAALEGFVRGMLADPRTGRAVAGLARAVARAGFRNGLSQLVVKLAAPGVPDFYQGTEALDLSLVDPDNRRPVDYAARQRMLDALEPLLAQPDVPTLRRWIAVADARAKFYTMVRLLRFRRRYPAPFEGGYRPLDPDGPHADHVLAFVREADTSAVLTVVPRFPAALQTAVPGGTDAPDARIALPPRLAGRAWVDVLTDRPVDAGDALATARLPLPWAVLVSGEESPAGP